jgi:EAL domain-containing protein (putative c-di-GMP-specific phosphodiesterase class I)
VENEASAERLQQLGCDELQGFLFARPMPAQDVVSWVSALPRQRSAGTSAIGGPSVVGVPAS